ncbi:SDR family oxidoreductase [Rhodopseudomonas sp. HC1]|uniref:SDR family NAD(P)-dependent oxidoreductase n=1 Tax=Rhodopseudomonas infernalis TaxID=2897386 RepID=UPI001EE92FBC|nr:SDR family oxidoreductase [Rhodopseudomonas infernalis]MCG6203613.1 SDR family oxidoreductase [Rhodopseudomonas infernalis]
MTKPVVVITGAAGGIGFATAQHFLSRGWTVHALDKTRPGIDGAIGHSCDVTDEAALCSAAQSIGPLDALVTAAGINLRPHDNAAERLSLAAWDQTIAVNLTGTMLTVRVFRPNIRPDGAIVVVGSVAALRAMPRSDAYTASKGAITALTRSWAVDYSRDGVRVNCVAPGPTDTAMMADIRDSHVGTQGIELPQQRLASPNEVAQVIGFLASPEASYVSGAVVPVDGGATAHSAGVAFPRRNRQQQA